MTWMLFIEYFNGPRDSEWGRKRASNGHRQPYGLRYLQVGNEERVDESYWQKFKPMPVPRRRPGRSAICTKRNNYQSTGALPGPYAG